MLICLHALPSSHTDFSSMPTSCRPCLGRFITAFCRVGAPGGRIFRSFVCFYGLKVWIPYRVPPRFAWAGWQKYGAVYVKNCLLPPFLLSAYKNMSNNRETVWVQIPHIRISRVLTSSRALLGSCVIWVQSGDIRFYWERYSVGCCGNPDPSTLTLPFLRYEARNLLLIVPPSARRLTETSPISCLSLSVYGTPPCHAVNSSIHATAT